MRSINRFVLPGDSLRLLFLFHLETHLAKQKKTNAVVVVVVVVLIVSIAALSSRRFLSLMAS